MIEKEYQALKDLCVKAECSFNDDDRACLQKQFDNKIKLATADIACQLTRIANTMELQKRYP